MSTPLLDLPQLTGTRSRAKNLLGTIPTDLSDGIVLINARDTLAGTESFVDEVVRQILVERNAQSLVVELAGPTLRAKFESAAKRHGVMDQLKLLSGEFDATEHV